MPYIKTSESKAPSFAANVGIIAILAAVTKTIDYVLTLKGMGWSDLLNWILSLGN